MTMRPLNFGQAPSPVASASEKLDYCVRAIQQIQAWTNENSASTIAKGFVVSNPTANRTIDVAAATLAQTRQVVGTILSDLAKGGAKRT